MKLKSILAMVAAALVLAVNVQAQTNTPTPPTPSGVIAKAESWLDHFDTNLSYSDVIVWDGPVYQDQVNVANELGASYDVWRSTTNTANMFFAGVEARLRQGAIAGAFVSEGVGGEFGWMKYDFRAGLFANGVRRENSLAAKTGGGHYAFELGAFADKMLSTSSAVGVFISKQTADSSHAPLIGVDFNLSFGNGKGFLGLF
jgi:hypothetical protein